MTPDRPPIAVLATADTKRAEAAFLRGEIRQRGWPVRLVDVGLGAASPPPPGPATLPPSGAASPSGRDLAENVESHVTASARSRSEGGGTPGGEGRPEPGDGDDLVDVSADQVAEAAGHRLAELRDRARRDEAMAVMADGAGRLLAAWHRDGQLAGAIGLGGNQGTAITAGAMRVLPLGVPKLVVSTVASGNIRGFVADSDIAVLFSVGDLLGGPNPVTARVLRQAAGAVTGMAEATLARDLAEAPFTRDLAEDVELRPNISARSRPGVPRSESPPVVAVTAFGNTHAAVTAAMERLADAGVQTVPFHASGASGSAMERLVDEGMFAGVLDLTTHELLGELYPADVYAPVRPGRLTAAGRRGVPQVVAPGGLEYHCFAAADTIPAQLRDRPTHHHNRNNTNVRASADELVAVAEEMACRLGSAAGPVAVMIPRRGWSEVGSPGGILHDPAANAAFVDALRRSLPPRVTLRELDCTINDPVFAAAAADTMLDYLARAGQAERTPAHTI